MYHTKTTKVELYIVTLIDIITVIISYSIASYLRYGALRYDYEVELYNEILLLLIICSILYAIFVTSSCNLIHGTYLSECFGVVRYHIFLILVLGTYLYLTKNAELYSRLYYIYFICLNGSFTMLIHVVMKFACHKYYEDKKSKQAIVIITTSAEAYTVVGTMKCDLQQTQAIVGVILVDVECNTHRDCVEGIPILARGEDYLQVITHMVVDEVLIYLPYIEKKELSEIIGNLEVMGVVCHYVIDIANIDSKARMMEKKGGYTVITYALSDMDPTKRMMKRMIDIVAGLVGCILTVFMFPIIALVIRMESPGPIVFVQRRVGKNGRIFPIYKFRSMYQDAEKRKAELMQHNEVNGLMFKMEDDPRITKVGKFLRKTSLDEFPQFINILKGEMSLIGTRPPTVDEYEAYTPYYKRRLSMTPGLTGMWQVSGRSEITDFDQVVQYDLEYIDNWSLLLDMRIICRTIAVLVSARGSK